MIEKFEGGTVITGEHIQLFRLLTIISGLKLEIKGMQMTRGNMVMRAAKHALTAAGIKPERTKKRILEQLEAYKIDWLDA